ncbi:hypothetical protein CKAH01_07401 [Colletotrichum kahawae]|uniref:Uncharacterized protein n=1 Tax=Colletotrichum kahawae TaxID=34407 RepID=A0AAD9Y6N1_COLKA|nr:hypothetical protein CKAH01_07401 [Colletotrichum kahawae]
MRDSRPKRRTESSEEAAAAERVPGKLARSKVDFVALSQSAVPCYDGVSRLSEFWASTGSGDDDSKQEKKERQRDSICLCHCHFHFQNKTSPSFPP